MLRKVTQNSFLGGQLDFEMMGRLDVERYLKGATAIRNFLPCRRGALRKRPGTDLRHDVSAVCAGSAGHLRLVPFSWREDDGWALLFRDGGIYAFSRGSAPQAVEKADDASWYAGAQVEEFDYCQCGDVMFVAHRDVPPQMIRHVYSGGAHSFRLEAVDINGRSAGRPTIASASVTKQRVLDLGGVVTESYKATAVYDGVETFPSPAFRGAASAGDDGTAAYEAWKQDNNIKMQNGTAGTYYPPAVTYDGTSYHAPWTKSQIIKLLTDMPTKNGAVPDQVRFYRRHGSFFGLVGFIQPGESSGGVTVTPPAIEGEGGVDVGADVGSEDALVVSFSGDVWGVRVKIKIGEVSRNGGTAMLRVYASMTADASSTAAKATKWKSLSASADYGDVELDFGGSQSSRGRALKIYKATGSATVRVKAVEVLSFSSASGTGDVEGGHYVWRDEYFEPDVSRTPPKEEYYMDGPGEYPGCVCLSQQRLIWASTRNEPSRVLMSQVGDFYTYAPHEAMVADDPVDFQVSATRLPAISHIVEMRKLLLFNGDSEWVVDSASESQGITFETIQARQHSAIGAASWLKPIVCDNVLLFAEKTGRAVRRYGYQLEDDGFGGIDVSFCSASIFSGRRIVSWAYQKQPEATCWCVLSDGTLASLTFVPEQQVMAWATHTLGGGYKALQVVATDAIVGNDAGRRTDTQVFILAKRTVNGSEQHRILELHCSSRHGSDTVAAAVRLDSATVATSAGGLLSALGEVAVNPTTGAVSHTARAAGDICGYPYESVFESVRPVVGTEVGAAQMDVKSVQEAHLRVVDAVGGEVRARGVPAGQASALTKTAPTISGGTVTLAEADESVPLVGDNSRDGRVVVTQSEPWPFTLLMLETDVETENEERGRR